MRYYDIYNPTVTQTPIVDSYDNGANLTYVSNSSLAYFDGVYYAVMDGMPDGLTEAYGTQQIWMTTSTDCETWSTPFQPFANANYTTNPIAWTSVEWQPNLVVVGTELWCTWHSVDSGGYISRLPASDGLWTTSRFEYVGTDIFESSTVVGAVTVGRTLWPEMDGISDWVTFFSQNPIVLSNGVVACPLTLLSSTPSEDAPEGVASFTADIKTNALFNWDGSDWTMVLVDTSDFGDYCAWEPFVVEDESRKIYVYSRNLDPTVTDDDYLLVSESTDGASSFGPSVSANMLVPSTRGFARNVTAELASARPNPPAFEGSGRYLMVNVDHAQDSDQSPTQALSAKVRINGALFWSRRGIPNFTPGTNFSGVEPSMNYPQFVIGPDNVLRVNYTSATGTGVRRSMQLVSIDPLPLDSKAYVHPRSVSEFSTVTPPVRTGTPKSYLFNGSSELQSELAIDSSPAGTTFTAWVNFVGGAALVDTRPSGAVFSLAGLSIHSLNFVSGLVLPPNKPTFMAAVVDNSSQTVTIYGANGGGFNVFTAAFRSILFTDQPAVDDTVTVNGQTYTFKTSAVGGNEITIGSSSGDTALNLRTELSADAVLNGSPGTSSRVTMARSDYETFTVSSGSSAITVEAGVDLGGSPATFGAAYSEASTLSALAGSMFEARVFAQTLTSANLTYLHNSLAPSLGLPPISGTSTEPAPAQVVLDAANPDTAQFPALADSSLVAARCEIVDKSTLRIHGEESAAIEVPYGVTDIDLCFKLGAVPEGLDDYVVASFGTTRSPARLHVWVRNPNDLYLEDRFVMKIPRVTNYTEVTARVYTEKVQVNGVELYFDGRPSAYLGSAFHQNRLTADKSVTFDVSRMGARSAG